MKTSRPRQVSEIARRIAGLLLALALALPWSARTNAQPAAPPRGHPGRPAAADAPLLIDINPGAAGSNPGGFVRVGGLLYFQADDGVRGSELWRTDGTAAGTEMVKDITPGAAKTRMYSMTALGGTLFFLRYTDASATAGAVELWRSDGTAAGTALVEKIGDWNIEGSCVYGLSAFGAHLSIAISPGWESLCASSVAIHTGVTGGTLWRKAGTKTAQTALNGRSYFFFSSNDPAVKSGLWASADTAPGIAYIDALPMEGELRPLGAGADGFYFLSVEVDKQTAALTYRLGKSTGAPGGTAVFATLPQGAHFGESYVSGQDLYFVLDSEPYLTKNEELWRSDGTAAGTVRVVRLTSSSANAYSSRFTRLGAGFAFLGPSGCAQEPGGRLYWLWASDGSAAGTSLVAPAVRLGDYREPGLEYGTPITPVEDKIAFFATDGAHGAEPWISDGTTAGTNMLADLAPGAAGSKPTALAALPGKILVGADDGASGNELWVLDPAPPAPVVERGPYRLYLPQITHSPLCAAP